MDGRNDDRDGSDQEKTVLRNIIYKSQNPLFKSILENPQNPENRGSIPSKTSLPANPLKCSIGRYILPAEVMTAAHSRHL